jgi:LacI family transcriptional regulator
MDGLLVVGLRHEETLPTLMEVRESGLPLVTLFDEPLHDSLPNVGMDQHLVARIPTRHLIERGCTRIAHIIDESRRFEGYKEALEEAGLPFRPELVYKTPDRPFSHTGGEMAVRALLEAGQRIDGFMAQADQEAMGVMNELARQDLSVPEDVRVAGIDNAPYCEFARVPLTSVSQRFDERGARAVEMLLRLVEGQEVASVELEPILHVRASSA